ESAPSPFAADVRVDTGFGICRGAENIFRPKTPIIVVAFGDGAGAVVVDGEDEITGLWHRVSYVYSANAALIDNVCITSAIVPNPSNPGTIESRIDDPDYLQSAFGFRPYFPSEAERGMSLDAAEALVSAALGRPLVYQFDDKEVGYDRHRAVVSDDLFYIPYTWIGCAGYIVERATSTVRTLGSGMGVEAQIWAWYRGVAYDRNDLEILAVHDLVELESLLREIMGNYRFRTEVAPRLAALPCLIKNLRLYPVCERLRRAEINNWFRFQIVDSIDCDIIAGVREVVAFWDDGMLARGEVEDRFFELATKTDIDKVLARLPAPWHDAVLAHLQWWAEAGDSEPITIFGGIYTHETEPDPMKAAEMKREVKDQHAAEAKHFKEFVLPAIRNWWAKRKNADRTDD
ncbi:MAG TPA: hypothetical protein PK156_42510, partial [Polyangium sp.]|nr:hypothetical protein [Polyangium sp.]